MAKSKQIDNDEVTQAEPVIEPVNPRREPKKKEAVLVWSPDMGWHYATVEE